MFLRNFKYYILIQFFLFIKVISANDSCNYYFQNPMSSSFDLIKAPLCKIIDLNIDTTIFISDVFVIRIIKGSNIIELTRAGLIFENIRYSYSGNSLLKNDTFFLNGFIKIGEYKGNQYLSYIDTFSQGYRIGYQLRYYNNYKLTTKLITANYFNQKGIIVFSASFDSLGRIIEFYEYKYIAKTNVLKRRRKMYNYRKYKARLIELFNCVDKNQYPFIKTFY